MGFSYKAGSPGWTIAVINTRQGMHAVKANDRRPFSETTAALLAHRLDASLVLANRDHLGMTEKRRLRRSRVDAPPSLKVNE